MSAATSNRKGPHEPIVFSQPGPSENRVSRIFRAPPERVFRLFTDPATLPYVYAPDPKSVTIEKFEFRKGGQVLLSGQNGRRFLGPIPGGVS